MPLNATFIADFSSFLDATANSVAAAKEFEAAAAGVGPVVDQSLAQAGKAAESAGAHSTKARADALELGKAVGSSLKNVASEISNFASGYIAEFAEAEASTARLEAALKTAGHTAPEVAKAYGEIATELQRMTAFSDEAITDAATLLTTVGGITPDNIRATLIATTELARGMGIDLVTAANLVAKAAATDGEELGKLGKILGDSVPKGADFATVLEAIMAKFSGQNAAFIQTTAGSMDQLKNSMSDINEQIGQAFAETLKMIFDWFQKLPEPIQTFTLAVVSIGAVIAPLLVALSSLVGLLKGLGLASLWSVISAGFMYVIDAIIAFLAYIGPVGWLILAIGALVTALWVYWDEIVAGVKWLWGKVTEWFTKIVEAVKELVSSIKAWLNDELKRIFDFAAGLLPGLVMAFRQAAAAIVGFSIVPDMVKGIGQEFDKLERLMVDPAWAAAEEATAAFAGIGDASLPTLTAGAGRGGGATTITVNMTGMLGTDDPQTRAMVSDLVSSAVMQGMRGGRLLGTA